MHFGSLHHEGFSVQKEGLVTDGKRTGFRSRHCRRGKCKQTGLIKAVDEEKKEREEADEPIMPKVEKSIEEARKAREMTANAAIRNKIYEKWVSYVFELYELDRKSTRLNSSHL